jgi:hypothetical protein
MRSHLFLIFYAIVPFYILYTIAPFRFSYAIALNLRLCMRSHLLGFCMRPHLFVCDRALSYAIAPLSKFVCGRVFFYVIASFLGFCMRSRLLVHDRGSFKSCMRSLPFCPLMPLFCAVAYLLEFPCDRSSILHIHHLICDRSLSVQLHFSCAITVFEFPMRPTLQGSHALTLYNRGPFYIIVFQLKLRLLLRYCLREVVCMIQVCS